MSTQTVCRISGRDKAAMLLLALGPAQSAEVLSRLDPHQVAAISQRFARLRDLGAVDTTPVVAEFERLAVSAPPKRPPSRIPDRQTPATASIEPPPCATEAVRDFDLSKLERFPSRSLQAAHRARPRDPSASPISPCGAALNWRQSSCHSPRSPTSASTTCSSSMQTPSHRSSLSVAKECGLPDGCRCWASAWQ